MVRRTREEIEREFQRLREIHLRNMEIERQKEIQRKQEIERKKLMKKPKSNWGRKFW